MARIAGRPPQEELDAPILVRQSLESEDEDVSRVVSEIGSNGKYIALNRMNGTTKKWEYVTKYNLAELEESELQERIKDEHGGGTYRARIYGELGFLKQVTFSIDQRFKPVSLLPPSAPIVSGPGGPASDGLGEIKGLLEKMIMLQMQALQAPKHDPFEVFVKAAEIFRPMNPAPVSASPQSFSEMFSVFKHGMEVGQAASGNGDGLGYLPVIEKLGGPLLEAINTMRSTPKADPKPSVVERVNKGGTTLVSPTPTTPEQVLQKYLPQFIALAKADKDPALYAELALDQIPESSYDYLYGVVTRPDMTQYLSGLHPGVKECEAWFLAFGAAIRESLSPYETVDSAEIGMDGSEPVGE